MKQIILFAFASFMTVQVLACDKCGDYNNDDFQIKSVSVKHEANIATTIWEITVQGTAGKTIPTLAGQLNGVQVLGYVFPTSLKPIDVGFSYTEGTVALALTSHPDFDDTPLWDENADKDYANDGIIWHPNWVVLTEDKCVEGGLAVKQFDLKYTNVVLPPTNPGMPMYMDSSGFQVITSGNTIKVVVPDYRMNSKTDFSYDGVAAYMQVNTGGDGGHGSGDKPMLGVYQVYSVGSSD